MSRNLHGRGCIHTHVDEVAKGGATEIVGDKALVLIPRLTCLFSESTLNTCLYPLTPEILRLEYCAVASEFLLEHGRELIREGTISGLRFLTIPGGRLISCSARLTQGQTTFAIAKPAWISLAGHTETERIGCWK